MTGPPQEEPQMTRPQVHVHPYEKHPTPPVRWVDTPLTAAQFAQGIAGLADSLTCIHGVGLDAPCQGCAERTASLP